MNEKRKKLILLSKESGYRDMMKNIRMWEDLFNDDLKWISIILSLLFTALVMLLNTKGQAINFLSNLLPTMIGGMIGLMAFSLSAIAIVTSTVSDTFLYSVLESSENQGQQNNEDKPDPFYKIKVLMYTFYFSGVMNLFSVFILTVSYAFTYFPVSDSFRIVSLPILSIITSCIVVFSLIYSLKLIGTCIKIRFLTVNDK